MNEFGEKLHELRTARGLTQSALAARAGFSESQIGHFEHGRRTASRDVAARLDALLGSGTVLTDLLRSPAESGPAPALPPIPGLDLLEGASPETRRSAADILVAIAAALRHDASVAAPRPAEGQDDATVAEPRVQPTSTP